MGVSVETSGIKVEGEKCYLVNLNADPSLNELLVGTPLCHGFMLGALLRCINSFMVGVILCHLIEYIKTKTPR